MKDEERSSLKTGYLIRFDDIAPNMNWDVYFQVKALLEKYCIKPIIGVIPDNQDPSLKKFPSCPTNFWDEIRSVQRDGWEIAMHGYQHDYVVAWTKDIFGNEGPSEFASLNYDSQLMKLKKGLEIFKKEKITSELFFAPSHIFDINTVRALKSLGFKSISDGYALFPFYEHEILFVPQLVGRPIAFPYGIHTSVHHLNNYSKKDYDALESFVRKNHKKIITYREAIQFASSGRLVHTSFAFILRWALQTRRRLKERR
ncbi:MAG: DUF2334 domain-containing protein [Oligoflexia bacterium]|nr:DUF2334 domain-containing protein [Oligoflexia bacterium]